MTKRLDIKTDPGYVLYGPDNAAFSPGESPKKVYVTVSGIQFGEDHNPDDYPPLNGTFLLERISSYVWFADPYPGQVVFWTGDGTTKCFCGYAAQYDNFYFSTNENGIFCGESIWTEPSSKYYGGGFTAVVREPSQSFAVQQTCADIVVGPAKSTYAIISPGKTGELITRIGRKSDATRIYVRRNIT